MVDRVRDLKATRSLSQCLQLAVNRAKAIFCGATTAHVSSNRRPKEREMCGLNPHPLEEARGKPHFVPNAKSEKCKSSARWRGGV